MAVEKTAIHVPSLAEAIGPFSRAVRVGNTLYISGTSAISHIPGPAHTRIPQGDIEVQSTTTLNNIKAVVEAAGGTMADIVKITVMLKDPADYQRMNSVRAKFFVTEPKPASSTFICGLNLPGMLVEMEAIAILDAPAS